MDEETTVVADVPGAPDASRDASSASGAKSPGGKVKAGRRRRPRAGRIAYSRDRDRALAALYRFGGMTARQLASWFEIVDPDLVGKGTARMPKALRAAYRVLDSLQQSRLLLRVAVVRDHEGSGRPEDLCYLSPAGGRAVRMGAALCGVRSRRKGLEAYERHNLPDHPEHVAFRTDVMLRGARDAAVAGVEFVHAESWGESCPAFPYWFVRPAVDKAGEPITERKNGRSDYFPNTPDLRIVLGFGDGLDLALDVEAEREVRTGALATEEKKARAGVIPKLEARADHQLRLLDRRERNEIKELKAERARINASLLEARRKQVAGRLSREDSETLSGKVKASEARMKIIDAVLKEGNLPRLAMPDGVVPVAVVMRTKRNARGMRDRIRRALSEGRLPRTAELGRRLSAYDGVEAGSLILFAGWDSLQPEVWENLTTGEAEVEDHGNALGEEFLPLRWVSEKEAVSLRDVAVQRARMSDAKKRQEA